MSSYVVTFQAEQDIDEIAAYIAANNPKAAEQFVNEAYDVFRRLAERPGMGHHRADLSQLPVRFWTLRRRYMIVYRGDAPSIEILRVLSGYRDIASILG